MSRNGIVKIFSDILLMVTGLVMIDTMDTRPISVYLLLVVAISFILWAHWSAIAYALLRLAAQRDEEDD